MTQFLHEWKGGLTGTGVLSMSVWNGYNASSTGGMSMYHGEEKHGITNARGGWCHRHAGRGAHRPSHCERFRKRAVAPARWVYWRDQESRARFKRGDLYE